MRTFLIWILAFVAVAAVPDNPQKIVGGTATTIANYPSVAALLYSSNLSSWWQACGGIILTTRSILTAAHCPNGHPVNRWRVRVGSTFGNSGGTVHNFMSYVMHHDYHVGARFNNDIAIMHTNTVIVYVNNAVRPATIAGPNYNVADNQVVWAAGWGATFNGGPTVETLRHVQIFTINQNTCVNRYREVNRVVTDNMLCSGVLDVGGRCQCQGDSGGPLYHNNVVVGVCSWSLECALPRQPGVNVRVSRYTSWIQQWAW